ncbi:hypothetical protein EC957_004450 [Mortierella hygrophila]|uniref:ABC transmembrane type-1 domain-containing protein n=1 Tax=Mortierella hygrophila TaxID=979708 RepID=A0A9P6K081_9FUNG|nr:hypothetical protein EC957_004450 [Mortierella hygrophila]
MYIVSLVLRETIQYAGSLHANRILHRKALDRVIHSPIRFFDTTPLGRIINRFTRDMDTVISALFVVIAAFYTRTSRELNRHETTTNSPELLDEHNLPYFYIWVCNRWLSIRVDILTTFVSLFAGLFIVPRRDTIDTGEAGLSLTYSLAFTLHVLWFVRTMAYNENNMNCVERVQEYMALPQEAPSIVE